MTDFAIGVVSQGIQVCSVIAAYIGTLKDRDEDLASIDRQAQGLESLTQGSLDPSTSPAAAQVLNSMQTCEAELNGLKQLAARFSDSISPNARPQDKIKQQVKKLTYPIQKPDICRIQKLLGAVKETLDLALQNLELSYSCLATSKLSNLEAASQQASSSLAALDSDISTLHTKLDDLLDRLPQNNTAGVAALDETDPRVAIYKLTYKPSNLAALCASLESTANVLQTAPIAEWSSCPCRRHIVRRTKRISWLPWDFWDDEILRFEHYKGCKYFRSNGGERSRVRGLRVTGLVKNAVIITLRTSTGAGGQSLGANIEYRATVDRMVSPAFRVISVLQECADVIESEFNDLQTRDQFQWERLVLSASHKLEYLFRLGKASAKDVDSKNQTLLHAAAEVASYLYEMMRWNREIGEAYSLPVAHLATLLIKRQVSASLLDMEGRQALAIATPGDTSSMPLAEAFYPHGADIRHPRVTICTIEIKPQDLAHIFSRSAAMLRVADEIDSFSLHRPITIDIHAMQIDEILRERGFIEPGPLTTYVDEGTFPGLFYYYPLFRKNASIYHSLSTAEDANIYFNLGFHDIIVSLYKPMSIERYGSWNMNLPFAKWLMDHDVPLYAWIQDLSPPWTSCVADAFILALLGGKGSINRCALEGDEELVRELEQRMLMEDSVDSCFCRCSVRGCTPFVVRLKRMGSTDGIWFMRMRSTDDAIGIATTFTAYLKEYSNKLRREHCYAAIRSITFDALGIAHTCGCRTEFLRSPKLDAEEIAEIQDEYTELLRLLESLIEEFETHAFETFDKATDGLDSMITFWNGYWVQRMSEVFSELSRAGEASKAAAEDLGVVWGPQPEEKMYEESELDFWDYCFQQIEEIE